MTTSVRDAGPHEKLITLVISSVDLDQAMDSTARKLSRELKIKGFRPGRAPRRVVEATVGPDRLRSEAIEDSIPALLTDALNEAEIIPVVTPSLERVDDIEDGVEIEVRVTTMPRITEIPYYQDREIEVESDAVSDQDLQDLVDRLRDQYAELEVVSRPAQSDDFVSINLTATHHGEPVEAATASDLLYEVGSHSFIEGLDDQLTGKSAGEIVRFNATLPDGFGEYANREVTIQVLVKDVRRKQLPDFTDDWVEDVTEFDSVEELRSELRGQLEEANEAALAGQFRARLLDTLLSELELDVPEAILGAEMDRLLHRFLHELERQDLEFVDYLALTGVSQEDFLNDLRRQADRRIRTDLLLDALVTEEGIEVTEEEMVEAFEFLAEGTEEEPTQMRANMREAGQENVLRSDILRRKALIALFDAAVPVDQQGRPIDLDETAAEAPLEGEASPQGEADKVET